MESDQILAIAAVASGAFAAISACAAAVSAYANRRSLSAAHAAFVWPTVRVGELSPGYPAPYYIRLYNDGPGTAFDVRISTTADEGFTWLMPPIRAMKSGETVPPMRGVPEEYVNTETDEFNLAGPIDYDYRTAVVAVRFEDSLGRLWEVREPLDPSRATHPPRQLRTSSHSLAKWRPLPKW